jgi:hypothetical protein
MRVDFWGGYRFGGFGAAMTNFGHVAKSDFSKLESMDYLVFRLHYRGTETRRENPCSHQNRIAFRLLSSLALCEGGSACQSRIGVFAQAHGTSGSPPRITLQDAAGSFSTSGSALDTSGIVTQF